MEDKDPDPGSSASQDPEDEPIDEDEERELEIDEEEKFDILVDKILASMGEFGLYQKFLFISTIPFVAGMVATYFSQLFIIVTPKEYWCKIPQLQSIDDPDLRQQLATPKVGKKWKNCYTYDADWDEVLASLKVPEDAKVIPCKHGFEFKHDEIPYTNVVTERNWVCDLAHYVPTSQIFFFLGATLGGFGIGRFADVYGRIPALIVANILAIAGGIFTIFTGGFWDFVICRIIAGMGFDNCFYILYIILLEYVGPHYRTLAGNLTMAIFYAGFCLLLPVQAYFISNWKLFTIVTLLPMIPATAILAPYILPESARWLVTRGKLDKAITIFKSIEAINKKTIPPKLLKTFAGSANKLEKNESYSVLMRSRPLFLAVGLVILGYSSSTIVYDCIMRLSGEFGEDDNFFISFSLYAATEIPSNLFIAFFLDRFGRRPFTYYSMGLAGIVAIIGALLPVGLLVVGMVILARTFIIVAYNTLTQWAVEILPTTVRASGSSFVHISGYVGSILAPFIAFNSTWHGMPLLILAGISFIGAACSFLLPETKGLLFPQSIPEGERMVIENSILYRKKLRRQRSTMRADSLADVLA